MRPIRYLFLLILTLNTACINKTNVKLKKSRSNFVQDWNKNTLDILNDENVISDIFDGKLYFPKSVYYSRVKEIIEHVRSKEMQIVEELFNSDVDAIKENCQLSYYCSASTVKIMIYKDGYAYDFRCYDGFDEVNPYNTDFYYSYVGRQKYDITLDDYKKGIIFTSSTHEELTITTFFKKGKATFSAIDYYVFPYYQENELRGKMKSKQATHQDSSLLKLGSK